MWKTASTPLTLTALVMIAATNLGTAHAAGRTYVPKTEDNSPRLETCRLKATKQVEGNTQCRYKRQSRGKDVFMTIEIPNAPCQAEFLCKRE